ncbi:transcriptional adapter 3-A [Aphidius gifuensis]|uniref:transcriptional adapter 3-A n=1 Tax=Aphidius gifuensis TaxID=684658 RepID=UPI001CDC9BEC|nr:transcriptional adapter 3-A [Aphidius gifuensis]
MSGKGKLNIKKTPIKVREGGKSAQSSIQNSETSPEGGTEHSTITLPVINVSENAKLLPKYTSILQRTTQEGVQLDELDTLQLELETLLSSVVVRYRMLQDEIVCLSSAEERRDKKTKSGKGILISSIDKKTRDDKIRSRDTNIKTNSSPLPSKLLKSKSSSSSSNNLIVPNPHEIARVEGSKTDIPKILLPKNDTTNKFWASVDPYCNDIMTDDINLLQQLIATHSDINDFKKIPPLGRHYSYLWAHNDLLQEEEAGNKEKKKNKTDIVSLITKGDKKTNGIAGPLTQRLVSAFLEENVYVANNNTDNKLFRDGDPPVLRDLSIQNSMNLELRMHKELVEQGILDPDLNRKNQDDDEILAEIKRCQQDLMALSSHNVSQLKRLMNLAQEETKRQGLKRKIDIADGEVVEHYKKLISSKQRKVPLTKKEQEKAWSCLKERETLLQQLNIMPSNNVGEPQTLITTQPTL